MIVEIEQHTFKMRLQYTTLEITQTAQRVSIYMRTGVLCHHQSVLIVQISQTEGILRHVVEELLLGLQVVLHRFMIVQMVARQVSENTSGKTQATDSLLGDGMRTDLHKGILATGIRHLPQESVQRNGIGRRMIGRHRFVVNVVAYGRDETYLIAEVTEYII